MNLKRLYDTNDKMPRNACGKKEWKRMIRIIQEIYKETKISVWTGEGKLEECKIQMRLRQGSALVAYLPVMLMDVLWDEDCYEN